MRAFLAIPVPPSIGQELLALVPPLKGLRRGRPDRLHLTLHFLAAAPDDLADRLQPIGLPPPFPLTPGRLILLPASGPVQVIAASATGDRLTDLHAAFGAALSGLGIPLESRPFLPYITLARCSPPLPQQVRGQTPMVPRTDVSFPVRAVELIESAQVGGTLEHQVRRTWPLG